MADLFQKLIEKETGQLVELEHQFALPRKWAFDYCIPKWKIAIEIEGGTFKSRTYKNKKTGGLITTIGGRHNSGTGFLKDMEKYNKATEMGWAILRFAPEQKLKQATFTQINRMIMNRKNSQGSCR